MIDWAFSVATGLLLGWALYLMVRMRGRLIPISVVQIGRGRRLIWALTMVLMVLLSNMALLGLRKGLLLIQGERNTLLYEAVFAVVSFSLAMYLVARSGCRTDCALTADK